MKNPRLQLSICLGSAIGFVVCLGSAVAQTSLSPEQKSSLSATFGRAPSITQQLQALQDNRFSARIRLDGFSTAFSDVMKSAKTPEDKALVVFTFWHDLALEMSALDHQTYKNVRNSTDIYGEEFGPARASWALAITHLAMFEAINTFTKSTSSYKPPRATESLQAEIIRESRLKPSEIDPAKSDSLEAAISQAAMSTLNVLYPKKQQTIDTESAETLNMLRGEGAVAGFAVGKAAAMAVLKSRGWRAGVGFSDGSELPEPPESAFAPLNGDVARWHADPISKVTVALGGNWSRVQPFVISRGDAFRPDPPPALNSADFAKAFKEVAALGGDPNASDPDPTIPGRYRTPTTRTGGVDPGLHPETNETFKAIFWGYDGTALLCAPPRLYNMIATTVARDNFKIDKMPDMARLLALINVAMADAAIRAR
jgi:hypothetical protein